MGHWQDKIVFVRDFAYPLRSRLRMATGNIGDAPAPSFAELLSGPLVDIYVGSSKQHWALHRNLLCHHSEYLSNRFLDGNTKETDLKLDLPENDPAGFELLVKWLYQGKLDDVSEISDEYQKYEYAVSCHKLWLICDWFEMPQLKNMAVDQYRKGLHEAGLVPDADEINEIYRTTTSSSPFRRLMTKIAARQIMDPDTEKDAVSYRACFVDNPEFAIELVNAIKNDSGGVLFEDPTEGDACSYHDHHDSDPCSVKGKSKQANIKAPTPPEDRPSEATSANHPLRHSHHPTLDPLPEKTSNNEVPPTPPQTPPPPPRRHASEILQRRTSTISATSSGISPLNVTAHRTLTRRSSESSIEEGTPRRPSLHHDGIQHHQNSDAKSRRDSHQDAENSFPWWAPRWQWRRAKSTSSVMGIH